MEQKPDKAKRRSFVKGIFCGALGIYGLSAASSSRGKEELHPRGEARSSDEVLYRETEEFRRYYESLRS